MRAFTKLSCLIICLALLFGTLTSCDVINGLLNNQGAKADPDKYTASVRIAFATNDDKMKAAVDAMSSSAVIMSDGSNLYVNTIAQTGGASVENTYTLVDGMLFHSLSISSGEITAMQKERSFADEFALEDILNKAGAAAGIDSSDFETVDSYTEGGLDVSSCSGATDEIKNDIEKLLSPRFAALGAEVKVEDVYLTLEKNGELIVSSVLSVSFKINMDGKVYEITMRTYTDYDYTAEVEISDLFFGWLLSFGRRVKILYPSDVLEDFRAYIEKMRDLYMTEEE